MSFTAQLRRNPLLTVANTPMALVGAIVGSWVAFGLAFAALEPDVGWFDGLYLGTVVQSTLGFGDVLPSAWHTKLLVMAYVWFCIYFLLPAAIFHVAETLIHDRDEEEAKQHDKEQTDRLRRIESMLSHLCGSDAANKL